MATLQNILEIVPQPQNREQILKRYQATSDIIKDMLYCFDAYKHQAGPTAKHFKGRNSEAEAKKIYDFIRHNFKYSAEPERLQTTRSFSRIIHDHNATVDCKHNALLASCIAWAMGYNVIFRFVAYQPGKSFGHVYVLIQKPGESKKYIIDPLQAFDYEKSYYNKVDYLFNNKKKNKMLSRLTGTDEPKRLTRNGLDVYVDGVGKIQLFKKGGVKKAFQKVTKGVKVVSLAPVRGAGLLLIDVNFRNFAGRLKKILSSNPAAIDQLVKTFGFDKNTLISNINKGSTKKPFLGGKVNAIGEPMTVAAAITAASPIIIALTKIFKDAGLAEPTDNGLATQAAEDIKTLPEDGAGFLDNIPKPVIYAGGTILVAGIGYGIYKAVKK